MKRMRGNEKHFSPKNLLLGRRNTLSGVKTKKKSSTNVRLCVTGGANVGKSAIAVRFLTHRFIGDYQSDIELNYNSSIDFGYHTIEYMLKDTETAPDPITLASWSNCIAIVYSITDCESFQTAANILHKLHSLSHSHVPCATLNIALIGNKNDLEHLREVAQEDGQWLADMYGATFWEASASEDYYSIFTPLTTLLVKSFLTSKDWLTANTEETTKLLHSQSMIDEKAFRKTSEKDHSQMLRQYSEPAHYAQLGSSPEDNFGVLYPLNDNVQQFAKHTKSKKSKTKLKNDLSTITSFENPFCRNKQFSNDTHENTSNSSHRYDCNLPKSCSDTDIKRFKCCGSDLTPRSKSSNSILDSINVLYKPTRKRSTLSEKLRSVSTASLHKLTQPFKSDESILRPNSAKDRVEHFGKKSVLLKRLPFLRDRSSTQ